MSAVCDKGGDFLTQQYRWVFPIKSSVGGKGREPFKITVWSCKSCSVLGYFPFRVGSELAHMKLPRASKKKVNPPNTKTTKSNIILRKKYLKIV